MSKKKIEANDFGIVLMSRVARAFADTGWTPQGVENLNKNRRLLSEMLEVQNGFAKVVMNSVLSQIDVFTIGSQPRHVVTPPHHFVDDRGSFADIRISSWNQTFTNWFVGMEEDQTPEHELVVSKLIVPSRPDLVTPELGKSKWVTIAQIAGLLRVQGEGQPGRLAVDGTNTRFYVIGKEGCGRVVVVDFHSKPFGPFPSGWSITACDMENYGFFGPDSPIISPKM